MNNIIEILKLVEEENNSAFFYTPQLIKNGVCYFFKKPAASIVCNNFFEINDALSRINKLKSKYPIAYGYISYETGYFFEEKLRDLCSSEINIPFMKFHLFESDQVLKINSNTLDFRDVESVLKNQKIDISDFKLNTSKKEYINNIKKIKRYIKEGETYQVNYTVKGKFNFNENIWALFLNLIFNQSASYAALINDEDKYVLSTSPELFFKTDEDRIISKPMKGTIERGKNIAEDNYQKQILEESKKDRAENIMIVDLLRNDIGKVSNIDSVKANPLFEIEKYESVFQMTSTVSGKLLTHDIAEIIRNIFPCGSITGAPKIRTMQIIRELEKEPRGVYTGAIGIIEGNEYKFNVPIRTISIDKQSRKGELGIGSGVVWDSDPDQEYNETILKGNFLTNPLKYFELIETILVENGELFLLKYHLNRLKQSTGYFQFNYDEKKIINYLKNILIDLEQNKNYKLKLLVDKWGYIKHEIDELNSLSDPTTAVISNNKIDSKNRFQYFKTTNRELYDLEYSNYNSGNICDVIFLNERNEITEGSRTNIFIKKDNKYFTPPLESGILNGCYREYFLDKEKNINEMVLTIDDICNADVLLLVNSVRKIQRIKNLYLNDQLISEYS